MDTINCSVIFPAIVNVYITVYISIISRRSGKKNVILFLIKHSLFNYSVIFPVIADVYITVYISIISRRSGKKNVIYSS